MSAGRLFALPAEVTPASDWCQRWTGGTHTWRHRRDGGFDASRYRVEPLHEAAAKAYVTAHHYSHSYPAAVGRWGLHEADGTLAGVAVLAMPMHPAVLTNVLPGCQPGTESLELSRLVLADRVPANAESWFLAQVWGSAAAGGVRGVVSFADPVPRAGPAGVVFPGHIGTVYQASNAVYAGRGTPRTLIVLPDGTVLPARAAQKVRASERGHGHVEARLVALGARVRRGRQDPARWLTDALDDIGATRLRHPGNHRYVFRLGTTRRARAAVQITAGAGRSPYPKPAAPQPVPPERYNEP